MKHELVTIEGSRTTKSTALEPGARIRVVRTPYIDALIAGGFVIVIDTEPMRTEEILTPAQTEAFEQAVERGDRIVVEDHDVVETKTFGGDVVNVDIVPSETHGGYGDDEVVVPPLNASQPRWAAFLTEQEVEYPTGAKRDQLIALWDAYERDHGDQ